MSAEYIGAHQNPGYLSIFVIILYLFFNMCSFALFGIDKQRAIHKKWRIPEFTLILSSVFGIFGGLAGMFLFHHKTKKPKFRIGLPLILILEIASLIAIIIL